MQIRHILLTTDLSEEALRPRDAVIGLAKTLGARVTLLHVVQDVIVAPHGAPLAPPMSSPDIGREVERARGELAEQVKELGLEGTKAEVLSAGDIGKAIVEYADQHGVDMIAISTHGRTGFKRLAFGSVAEDVLRHSHVPVLSFHRPH